MKKTLAAIILAMTGCQSTWLTQNLHHIPPTAYRSAQLDKEELEELIKKHDIKTIINLRGEHHGKDWYEQEQRICKQYGVQHVSVRLSAGRLPTKTEITRLITAIDNAEPQIYFHCAYGADRTGFASAVYRLLNKEPLEKALSELTFYPYGYVSAQINEFFELYKNHVKKTGKQDFRNWALNVY